MKTLTPEQAKLFYDDFGSKQDDQSWYEEPAVDRLIQYADFTQSQHVLEIGCGTGQLAHRLLKTHLPATADYTGIDISDTMIALATERTGQFRDRVTFLRQDVRDTLPFSDHHFDRIITTYVLDIFPKQDIYEFLDRVRQFLIPGGILGIVSITRGNNVLSKVVMGSWGLIHRISPARVGGCRPLAISNFLRPEHWDILHHSVLSVRGIASEITVLRRKND
ncbi:MAG: class I SAM-dependent methyltransferase [Fidelibacterota bacterium]